MPFLVVAQLTNYACTFIYTHTLTISVVVEYPLLSVETVIANTMTLQQPRQ